MGRGEGTRSGLIAGLRKMDDLAEEEEDAVSTKGDVPNRLNGAGEEEGETEGEGEGECAGDAGVDWLIARDDEWKGKACGSASFRAGNELESCADLDILFYFIFLKGKRSETVVSMAVKLTCNSETQLLCFMHGVVWTGLASQSNKCLDC